MTLASIALHFRPIRRGSQPDRQPPAHPTPLPSATNEKDISRRREGHLSRSPWPLCVCVLLLTGFDALGVAGFLARRWGWAGRSILTASLHSQLEATTFLSSFLSSSPLCKPAIISPFSLPAHLLLTIITISCVSNVYNC